ncbi:hypothetical protein [Micromonospora sp. CPCC 206061]|uniref:hypothetical protein n=1 Tax=Micromonospora sp. CPCC 206061 TaxID=3122410 RepID=UPI002FEEDBEF
MTPGSREARRFDAGRSPLGLAGGAAAMVGATFAAAALFPAGQVPARLVVVAVAVSACSTVLADKRDTFAVTGLGYLLFTGFLVNSYGELSWDGANTVWHLLVLAVATMIGIVQRWIRAALADLEFETALRQLLDEAEDENNGGSTPE